MHDRQIKDYLRIALKLNQTNLESTIKYKYIMIKESL